MFDVILILTISFVPMFIYAAILMWFDRYEKEPAGLLLVAFLWGAVPSIITALILQIVLDVPVMAISPNQLTYELVGGSIVAPLTEEGIKALALLFMVLFIRFEIDSPIDGLVYAGLIGFGFAAVENAFYLFSAYAEGGIESAVSLGFLRSGLFGLNHAMYTGFTGLGIAFALELKQKWVRIFPVIIGFIISVLVHALHNLFATFSATTGGIAIILAAIADYTGVFVLLVVAGISYFVERKRISDYTDGLVKHDRLDDEQAQIVRSILQRRFARLRLLFSGDIAGWRRSREYYQRLTEAAFTWHRAKDRDKKAIARLRKLEREYTELGWAMKAKSGAD